MEKMLGMHRELLKESLVTMMTMTGIEKKLRGHCQDEMSADK
jgi:hypothetical protein